MTRLTLSVPEISCDHCKATIEEALGRVPGVRRAAVRVPEKAVELEFDPDVVSRTRLVRAIEDQGFTVASS